MYKKLREITKGCIKLLILPLILIMGFLNASSWKEYKKFVREFWEFDLEEILHS